MTHAIACGLFFLILGISQSGHAENVDPEVMDGTPVLENYSTNENRREARGPERGLREDFSTGKIITSISSDTGARAVKLMPDGKILVGGFSFTGPTARDFAFARYHPDGSLDTSFAGTGKQSIDINSAKTDNVVHAMATDSQGRIIAAGRTHNGQYFTFAVARLNTDGSLDTANFGTSGVVITTLNSNNAVARGVAIQDDDKIVVAGYAATSTGATNYEMAVTRYLTDGTLDTTFNGSGVVQAGSGTSDDVAYAMALDGNGRIVIGGYTLNSTYRFQLARINTNGSLDTAGFGTGGIVTTDISSIGTDVINGIVIQTDNKIIAAGYAANSANFDFAVARYQTNGSLDTANFGTLGVTKVDVTAGQDDIARPVILQNDGKILVGGRSFNGTDNDFALIRLNTDGTLDTANFGTGGKITTPVGSLDDLALALDFQNGEIVAAGHAVNSNINALSRLALVRYNVDGSVASSGALDKSFNAAGWVVTTLLGSTDEINGIALQTDGKVVATGRVRNSSGNNDLGLARYSTDGVLDTTFGTSFPGRTTRSLGTGDDEGNGALLMADGKVLVPVRDTGNFGWSIFNTDGSAQLNTSFNVGTNPEQARAADFDSQGRGVFAGYSAGDFVLARMNTNGTRDTSFGTGGIFRIAVGTSTDEAYATAVQPDDKSVTVGRARVGTSYNFAVIRTLTTGRLDTSFNGNGKIIHTLSASSDEAYGVLLQPDHKILAAGFATMSNQDFAVTRYLTDGSLDTSWNGTGVVTTSIGLANDRAYSLSLQPNGKVLVGGFATVGANTQYAVARYLTTGALDTSFNDTGKALTTFGGGNEQINSMVLQNDGRIVVGGFSGSGGHRFSLARFWP